MELLPEINSEEISKNKDTFSFMEVFVNSGKINVRKCCFEELLTVYLWQMTARTLKALMEGPQQGLATKLLNLSRQQISGVIGLLTGHLGLNGHLYKIGKDINPLSRRYLNGYETVEHLLCECESLTMSRSRIFGERSFGELQQLSHVPVDLFRRFVTEI